MQKSSWYDLAVIVIIGVILADFVAGFSGPFGGGSGVITSGVVNLWTTTVNAMLGQPVPDQPKGPNPPGSQKTPAPKAVSPKPKKKPCFTFFGVCVPFTGG